MIMAGKAQPNQEAKFTTLPFWGKILRGIRAAVWHCLVTGPLPSSPVRMQTLSPSVTHELTWPCSTRLGVVPVRVAMPPMLAE